MNLLRIAIFNISYIRGLFPEKYFNDKSVPAFDMKIKELMPVDAESRRLIDWMEKGVYDALQKKYLKTLLFCICEAVDGPMIEEYTFSFSYSTRDCEEVSMNINCSGIKKGVKFAHNSATEITPSQMRSSACKMVRTLIHLMNTLEKMPEERIVLMKLLYYDDVTPMDYEPPFFRGCTEEEARNPLKMEVGKVKSMLDPFEDENKDDQDDDISLGAASLQKVEDSDSDSDMSNSDDDQYVAAEDEQQLGRALYHTLPLEYITVPKLQNKLQGEASTTTVHKVIDKMAEYGYFEPGSSRRLSNRVVHSDVTKKKLIEVKKQLVPDAMELDKKETGNKCSGLHSTGSDVNIVDQIHGTCVASIVGPDYVVMFTDGRGVCRTHLIEDRSLDYIADGEAIKSRAAGNCLILAFAGKKVKAEAAIKKVLDELDTAKKMDIISFAELCDPYIPEYGNEERFDILAVGYVGTIPYVYNSMSKVCKRAGVGTLHGIGSSFPFVMEYLNETSLEGTCDEMKTILRKAFVVATLRDSSHACGGYIISRSLFADGAVFMHNEGHVINLAASNLQSLQEVFDCCFLLLSHDRPYSDLEEVTSRSYMERKFPTGVMRMRRGYDTIIWAVCFANKKGLVKAKIKCGSRPAVREGGVVVGAFSVAKPKILNKYAHLTSTKKCL